MDLAQVDVVPRLRLSAIAAGAGWSMGRRCTRLLWSGRGRYEPLGKARDFLDDLVAMGPGRRRLGALGAVCDTS